MRFQMMPEPSMLEADVRATGHSATVLLWNERLVLLAHRLLQKQTVHCMSLDRRCVTAEIPFTAFEAYCAGKPLWCFVLGLFLWGQYTNIWRLPRNNVKLSTQNNSKKIPYIIKTSYVQIWSPGNILRAPTMYVHTHETKQGYCLMANFERFILENLKFNL